MLAYADVPQLLWTQDEKFRLSRNKHKKIPKGEVSFL